MPDTMIQNEGEKLTHICFIMSGECEYVMKRPIVKPYYTLMEGQFFGGEDIYFAMKKYNEKVQRKK